MRARVLIGGALTAACCGLGAVAAVTAAPAERPGAGPGKTSPLPPQAEIVQFFEKEIRPVLATECYSCHGPRVRQGNLRVDSREGLLRGGDRGSALAEGAPEKSLLLQAVNHQGLKMPPGRKLPARQLAAFEKWVNWGAPWPGGSAAGAKPAPQSWDATLKARRTWWSLLPPRAGAPPKVKNLAWSTQPIDRFVLAKLENKGLQPAAETDPRTLIRRVTLLLTGLPPSASEVDAFEKDFLASRKPSIKDASGVNPAYERLVDRLLASPQYGERFARHWMDVVRFGETHGYEWNYEVRDAWRYRDYLIRAFNTDVPYDLFVREHIVGDLITEPRWNREEGLNESLTGTAFFRFGENGHDVFKEIGLDVLDNQIDTLSKAFQATTVSCARCHDHKLDAVSTRDYYALLGILVSSRQVAHTLDAEDLNAERKSRLKSLKAEIQREISQLWTREAADTPRYLLAAQAVREARPDAASLSAGLDPARLQGWVKLLEKRATALEDPLAAWNTAATSPDPRAAWKQFAARLDQERKSRQEFNLKNFTPWGDFRSGKPEGWRIDGLGLRDGPGRSGDFAVSLEGTQVLSGLLPAGFFSNALSNRLNGSIQSPWLPTNRKFVSLRINGGNNGVLRNIPDHRQLTDAGREIKEDAYSWVTLGRSTRDEWVYLDLITKLHNPRYAGSETDLRSHIGISEAVLHDQGEAPRDDLNRMARLFSKGEPQTREEIAQRYGDALQQTLAAWSAGKSTDDDARWLDWFVRQGLLSTNAASTPRLNQLVSTYRETEKGLKEPRLVAGVADQDAGFDVPVYLRGDFRNVGSVVPRRYLEVLSSSEDRISQGSGRWDLARHLTDPRNPLTGRVIVNRAWHWIFGTGLARTTDDFGHMGEAPSHPELLDYLAANFVAPSGKTGGYGWSIKKLVRSLVLSKTFRMSSTASARGREIEPENRLLHHFPARRMEAEAIRDSILAVSGRLDPTLYGPSIQPFRDNPKPERRLFPGPLDGNGRRSVYTKITLMGGPRFLEVFNFPDPKIAQGRRDVTNVPAQALTLLNDPFVTGQAEFWADRLIAAGGDSVGARITDMFRAAFGRSPRPAEMHRWEGLVRELATLHGVAEPDVMKNRAIWKDAAHSIFNVKEFVYIR